ncbi:MAG: NACHT domain-containing protein [Scytonematopsis contorta HA4267-MV1]|jgi:DNA-binding Xre family transcriptional regulator|nr:NACHT domain-containing protein [Scytonematopsis contorta HA4267-MV1]
MGFILSESGKKIIDTARERKGWNRQSSGWAQQALVSEAALKRFWMRKSINPDFFKSICNAVGVNWEEVVDYQENKKICLKEDCDDMPDVNIFYGREQELANLEQSILQNRYRVVALSGAKGIGKTALAAKLTEKVKSDFEYFTWRSLNYSPAPSLPEVLSSLIKFLSYEENPVLSGNVDSLIAELLKIFSEHRVLLVLDAWENVLRYDESTIVRQTDYEKYGELLRLLGERKHQSCVVITTDEESPELSLLAASQAANLTRLSGLDFKAGLEILKLKELKFTQEQARKLINEDYCGNPLQLLHICGHIQTVFAGQLTQFQIAHTIIYPLQVETAINEHCKSLYGLDAEILQIIATESAPIDYEKLKLQIKNEPKVSNSALQTALSSLFMRSLIERSSQGSEILYSLQPVIRKCVRKFFEI